MTTNKRHSVVLETQVIGKIRYDGGEYPVTIDLKRNLEFKTRRGTDDELVTRYRVAVGQVKGLRHTFPGPKFPSLKKAKAYFDEVLAEPKESHQARVTLIQQQIDADAQEAITEAAHPLYRAVLAARDTLVQAKAAGLLNSDATLMEIDEALRLTKLTTPWKERNAR